MRGDLDWRETLQVGSVVIAGDDNHACVVIEIDGDTVTVRPKDDESADTFQVNISDLK